MNTEIVGTHAYHGGADADIARIHTAVCLNFTATDWFHTLFDRFHAGSARSFVYHGGTHNEID